MTYEREGDRVILTLTDEQFRRLRGIREGSPLSEYDPFSWSISGKGDYCPDHAKQLGDGGRLKL